MADTLAPLHPGELACQLVVSDRPDRVREAMQRRGLPLLNVLGHEVATAASGEAGLQRAAEFASDLVLLDINMPGLDGFAVAERLRQRFDRSALQLVALTGYGQDDDLQRTRRAGFDCHLVKPVDARRLE